jgi:drug/metabolite transporter (DMT)-like permease
MTTRDWSGLLLLAALWGASYLFMRVGAPEFGPVPLIGIRLILASLPLVPLLWWRGGLGAWRRNAWPIFVAGLFNCALPFCLIAWAELALPAGPASILCATTSLMASLWAAALYGERFTLTRIIGLALGFAGVAALVFHDQQSAGSVQILPSLAVLLASASYGGVAHYTRKRLVGIPALTVTTGSLASAALLLLPLTIWGWPQHAISTQAWLSVGGLALLSTSLAFLFYYRLIARVGATRATAVAYLIPLFGVLWGVLFLGEPLYLGMLFGAVLILGGVGLIHRPAAPQAAMAVEKR